MQNYSKVLIVAAMVLPGYDTTTCEIQRICIDKSDVSLLFEIKSSSCKLNASLRFNNINHPPIGEARIVMRKRGPRYEKRRNRQVLW